MITRKDIIQRAKEVEQTEHKSFDIYVPRPQAQKLVDRELKATGLHYQEYLIGSVCKGFTVFVEQ